MTTPVCLPDGTPMLGLVSRNGVVMTLKQAIELDEDEKH